MWGESRELGKCSQFLTVIVTVRFMKILHETRWLPTSFIYHFCFEDLVSETSETVFRLLTLEVPTLISVLSRGDSNLSELSNFPRTAKIWSKFPSDVCFLIVVEMKFQQTSHSLRYSNFYKCQSFRLLPLLELIRVGLKMNWREWKSVIAMLV
jgi:hypothetical protein